MTTQRQSKQPDTDYSEETVKIAVEQKVQSEEVKSFFQQHPTAIIVSLAIIVSHGIGLPATCLISVLYFALSSWFKVKFKGLMSNPFNTQTTTA